MKGVAPRVAFILFALLWVTGAEAACTGTCFWIGGTGTLNLASDSAHWSNSSGGASCSCEPSTTDDIIFDGSSGGGTVTVNVGGTWTAASLTMAAFTGTLTFATNNDNFTTVGNVDNNGTTATFNMGNGTWTLSGASAFFRIASGATFNSNSSTIVFTSTSAGWRRVIAGGKTYNAISVSANSAANVLSITSAATIGTLSVSAPNRITFTNGATTTITTLNTVSGSSGSEVAFMSDGANASALATISSANNWTCTWCGIQYLTFSGGGTFSATSSFDLGGNSGITITAPSGGAGGGRIIGG